MPLKKFWQTLESLPGLAAITAEWRALLGTDYDAVRGFLQPTTREATAYRSPQPGRNCVHKVVKHGPGDYVGVCPNGCGPVSLLKSDVIIYELDTAVLGRAVAQALSIEHTQSPVASLPKTARIGTYAPYAGFRFPVYLTIRAEPDEFGQAIHGLMASTDGPFILLAPTRELCKPASEELLKHRKASLLPLSEILALDRRGRFVLADGLTIDTILADFRSAVLPPVDDQSGMIFFPTPPDARWENVTIRFRDGHTLSVNVGGVSQVCDYTKMGMADGRNGNPTKQWELLRDFAEAHGHFDWSNRKAGRTKQKQRETLADNLRAFLRIEGDPFVAEGTGWRARFAVSFGE